MSKQKLDEYQQMLRYVRRNVLTPRHSQRKWSVRAAARMIGVSPRMITYVMAGEKISRAVLFKLSVLPARPSKKILATVGDGEKRLVNNPAWSGRRTE